MGRPPRIEVPGGYYHVHTRGNDRQDIYFGNWSGRLFLRELERVVVRYGWRILAYCLMPNHYHARCFRSRMAGSPTVCAI